MSCSHEQNIDPLDLSIAKVSVRLQRRELTSEALTAMALQRAAATQPELNAFISVWGEGAVSQARERDREVAAGHWRGPLHGIPLAHKDCFECAGRPMTVGSRVVGPEAGVHTATAVARLEQAGAVDLGQLNMSEMVAGPTGQNPHFGDCCNAWDPARVSGGSSSGSAVAVASGSVFGSLGSDTGGSIRLPASMNGLFGLKPTYGRVSRAGCFPRAFSLDCVGPLARSAEDCALLLQTIAGPDPRDRTSLAAPIPAYADLLESASAGSRIAVLGGAGEYHPEIAAAFDRFLAAAKSRYKRAPFTQWPELPACYAMGDIISKVEAATLHGQWMREQPQRYSQAVYSRTEPGLHVPAVRYLEALTVRAGLLSAFLHGPMADADVLICPTVPVPVPTRVEADMEGAGRVFGVVASLTILTRPFNYLGVPVLSMPIGLDASGMPIGAQLIGRPWGEARLLAMAHALSGDLGWSALPSARLRNTRVSATR